MLVRNTMAFLHSFWNAILRKESLMYKSCFIYKAITIILLISLQTSQRRCRLKFEKPKWRIHNRSNSLINFMIIKIMPLEYFHAKEIYKKKHHMAAIWEWLDSIYTHKKKRLRHKPIRREKKMKMVVHLHSMEIYKHYMAEIWEWLDSIWPWRTWLPLMPACEVVLDKLLKMENSSIYIPK